jgi:hypothetical protein
MSDVASENPVYNPSEDRLYSHNVDDCSDFILKELP